MSGCDKYQELISRMIDDDLSAEESAHLAEHLEVCPECRAMHMAFSAISGAISQDMTQPPESLRENIMAQVRREDIKKKNRFNLSKPMKNFVAAAACLALIVGLTYGVKPLIGNRAMAPTADKAAADQYSMVHAPQAESEAAPMDEPAQDGSGIILEDGITGFGDARKSDAYSGNGKVLGTQLPHIDLTESHTWESLASILGGKSCDIAADELSDALWCILTVDEKGDSCSIGVYLFENKLYYNDPTNSMIYLADYSPEDFEILLASIA